MENKIKTILAGRKNNKNIGVPSYCTASDIVIKALLKRAAETKTPVLIESTANQVNQFGGYTGMKPCDFVSFVYELAEQMGCPKELIILGGDHLGPLTFKNLPESEAMEHSKTLVYEYVKAGFTKIHLDTSMKLADDDKDIMLSTETIALRGAILYKECERAFAEIDDGSKEHPVFVIGSEVPIPGGATEAEDGIEVTKVADFADTISTYRAVFERCGIIDAFQHIVGVVVQPGVEFSDTQVFMYDRAEASELTASIKDYEGLVFEGHSTDYQTPECLKEMVLDDIAILKVGPAMTYRLREALFLLSYIEAELIPADNCADFPAVLERAMLENSDNWKNHYHGDERELALARRYSYSDRARYYLTDRSVKTAIDKLLDNFKGREIPMNVLHQFLPTSYQKVIRGELENNAIEIVYDAVLEMALDYEFACN